MTDVCEAENSEQCSSHFPPPNVRVGFRFALFSQNVMSFEAFNPMNLKFFNARPVVCFMKGLRGIKLQNQHMIREKNCDRK